MIREDLRLRHAAVRAGWTLNWPHFDEGIGFMRDNVHVWGTGRDWRARTLKDGRYEGEPRVYERSFAGLRQALETEGGVALELQTFTDDQVAFLKSGWHIPPERDHAAYFRNPIGGDNAIHLVPTEDGQWAVTRICVRNEIVKNADPLVAAAAVTGRLPTGRLSEEAPAP